MIIIGYQGIGKSTISNRHTGCIDLESGNFWNDENKRSDDWYIYYCNIAVHLSKQGYIVFTSSHECVRNRLKDHNDGEYVSIICPAPELKDQWIDKLQYRYERTKKEKDYKAYMNAKERYTENINELISCGLPYTLITDIDYYLIDLIKTVQFIEKGVYDYASDDKT